MTDLAHLLGEDDCADQLTSLLGADGMRVARLTGPPGSGKSFVGRMVADAWCNRGGAAIFAVGDDANSSRLLYPLRVGLASGRTDWGAVARTSARSAVAVGGSAIGSPSVATTIFDLLSSLFRQQTERTLSVYSQTERDVLLDLRRLARRRRLLVVADNAHWWDATSLSLIRDVVSERLRSSISHLDSVSVLLIDTASDQAVAAPPVFASVAELAGRAIVHTKPIEQDSFAEVLAGFGLTTPLPPDVAQSIYNASGGHLKVIEQVVCTLTRPAEGGWARELDLSTLIDGRLAAIAAREPDLTEMLACASLLGLSCEEGELACLTGLGPSELEGLIERAEGLGFVERSHGRLAFSHDVIRAAIANAQSSAKTRAMAASFAECLAILRPGDYEARATILAIAGDRERFREMMALSCVARLRAGEPLSQIWGWLRERVGNPDPLLEDFLALIALGYRSVAEGEFLAPLPDLRTPAAGESRLMAAERDYVASICLMENQTVSGAQEAVAILSSWAGDVSDEAELRIRFLLLLQQAYVLAGGFERARDVDREAYRMLAGRQRHDPTAAMLIQIQNRRAGATMVPEIAVRRIQSAVDYFAQARERSSRDELEWFRALTNMSGIELRLGRDAPAYSYAVAAEGIAVDTSDVLPRIDVLASNLILAAQRSGEISAAEAVEKQAALVSSPDGTADSFIHRCNLAGYMLLDGQDDAAHELLLALESELRGGGFDETYLQYYWGAMAASAAALRGDIAEALERHHGMDSFVAALNWPCAGYVRRRHARFADLVPALDLAAPRAQIDVAMIKPSSVEIGPAWPYYGRFMVCCELSFWSDS